MDTLIPPQAPQQRRARPAGDIIAPKHQSDPQAPQKPAHTPVHPASPAPQPTRKGFRDFRPPKESEDKASLFKRLQMPVIIILGIIGGFLVQSAPVGQTIIIGYGVIALIMSVDSRTTFTLALLAIITTVLLLSLQHNSLLAQTFAGYALLLFLVGVLCAAREVRAQKALLSKKRGAARRY